MIPDNSFRLREKQVWIYAAGSVGAVLLKLLRAEKIHVQGFIDRRAHVIERYHGLPVKTLQEAIQLSVPEDSAVIITVRNVFDHSSIAEQLYRAGFRNLIFKPLERIWGNSSTLDLQEIDRAHDALLVDIKIPDFPIPIVQDSSVSGQMEQISILRSEVNVLYAAIPIELLIINYYKDNIWSNVPVLGYFPAIELYQGFNGSAQISLEDCLEQYIESMASYGANLLEIKQTEDWRQNTLEARHSVYVEMDLLFQIDPEFFLRNCAAVKWNERGCFELISSGKNRISFLIAKGMSYIPVKMPADDFNQWKNQEACREVSCFLQETKQSLFCKIPHPDYYHFPVQTPGYTQKWILPVCITLTKSIYTTTQRMNFSDYCIYVQDFDQGALSRTLDMFGFQLLREQNDALTERLDRLMHFKGCNAPQHQAIYASVLNFQGAENEIWTIIKRTKRFLFCWMEQGQVDWCTLIQQMGFACHGQICECISAGRLVKGLLFERPAGH